MFDRSALNRRRARARPGSRARGEEWRHNLQRFSAHDRARILVLLDIEFALQMQTLDRSPAMFAQTIEVRTFVHDHRLVVSDVGHVGRFIDDGNVLLHRNNGALHILIADVFVRHEDVFAGVDVVITVGPFVNSFAALETRLRRQRRPADMLIARAP